jgi:hypothetical protein
MNEFNYDPDTGQLSFVDRVEGRLLKIHYQVQIEPNLTAEQVIDFLAKKLGEKSS